MTALNDHELEIREAVLAGMAVELIPDDTNHAWYLRIGVLDVVVRGSTAAHAFLNLADILSTPVGPSEQ